MTLATGSKLGPYEILAPLGAGGMGEVYRARDKKLDRDVVQNRIKPAERRHVRDSAAHDSRADHRNVRDVFFVRHAA